MVMRKKLGSIMLLAGILLILVPVGIAEAFSGAGSGTQEDPYIITNVNELQEMSDDLDAWYELGNDINASDTKNWNNNLFEGHSDGKGHTVSSLYINRPDMQYVGLFGCFRYGEIKNLGLVDINVTGHRNVGGLVGSINWGTVTNCYSTGDVSGDSYVGNLVGYNYEALVTDCYSAGNITGEGDVGGLVGYNDGFIAHSHFIGNVNGDSQVGGLVGYNWITSTVSNCYSRGSVKGNSYRVGGIVGWNRGDTNSCYSEANITGGSHVGGFVGLSDDTSNITDCYATGSVTGSDYVGGFVGHNDYDFTYGRSSTLTNCYSVGSVRGEGSYVGGFAGSNDQEDFMNAKCINCFWDTETSGQIRGGCGTGKTTAEMKRQATFTNWDFDTVWDIVEDVMPPFLRGVSSIQ